MPFMSAEHRAALERMMTSKFSQDEEDSLEPAFGELESAFSSQMNREQQTRFVNQKTQDSGDDDGSVSSSIDEEKEETYLNLGCSGQPAKEMLQPTGETEFRRLRLLFVLCLLVIGLIVSVATFLTLREQETLNSIRSFQMTAANAKDHLRFRVTLMVRALADLSDRITVEALSTNSEFPEVTLPYFEVSAGHIRRSTLLETVVYAPVVEENERDEWELYAARNAFRQRENLEVYESLSSNHSAYADIVFTNFTYRRGQVGDVTPAPRTSSWLPLWHISPPLGTEEHLNFDLLSAKSPDMQVLFRDLRQLNHALLSPSVELHELQAANDTSQDRMEQSESPQMVLMSPVYSTIDTATRSIQGVTVGVVTWDRVFNDLDLFAAGIVYRLEGANGQSYVYDAQQNKVATRMQNFPACKNEFSTTIQLCQANCGTLADLTSVTVYATTSYISSHQTWRPGVFAAVTAAGFASVAIVFLLYDRVVQRKNAELRGAAERTTALVSSLFPANVHDRLFDSKLSETAKANGKKTPNKTRLSDVANENFAETATNVSSHSINHDLEEDEEDEQDSENLFFKSKPIADLFPSTTIMFADLAGFTAWSSSREPHQVFVLLETVYRDFDVLAKRRGVFKVETVGDCYVAVCGLPRARNDHAVVMAKFARDCVQRMHHRVKKLEARLGPDTGDLQVRVGLHSGPVTGGVLRGEGSRFQLFGDSMNTASRIETTGEPNKIHISQATADLLKAAGKEKWLKQREGKIVAKGKGEMQTYWLKTGKSIREASRSNASGSCIVKEDVDDNSSESGSFADDDDDDSYEDSLNICDDLIHDMVSEKTARLIEWNVDILQRLLKQVLASRQDSGLAAKKQYWRTVSSKSDDLSEEAAVPIILPPPASNDLNRNSNDVEAITLDPEVLRQLKDFVTNVAIMYRNNPYHNFEHASQVTLSITKYLSRIALRSKDLFGDEAAAMHDATFRVTSDPLTQFALVFSALILDVDHSGVPNSSLTKEKREMLSRVSGTKSLAESNSFRLTWDLLMDNDYKELRQSICTSKEETTRFRQIVLRSVLATDVSDPEIQNARNLKWQIAYSGKASAGANGCEDFNEHATTVIELLMQSADLSHAFQHYQVYCKWCERLFMEMYKAHCDGRVAENPASHWYESQRFFFTDIAIPMASKLEECNVFGPSYGEELDYARKNLEQWECNGKEIVKSMTLKAEASFAPKDLEISPDLSLNLSKFPTNASNVSAPSTNATPELHVERIRPSTVKVGDKDVTASSLTMALNTLMLQVQMMALQEESLQQHTTQDEETLPQFHTNEYSGVRWAEQR